MTTPDLCVRVDMGTYVLPYITQWHLYPDQKLGNQWHNIHDTTLPIGVVSHSSFAALSFQGIVNFITIIIITAIAIIWNYLWMHCCLENTSG